MPKGKKFTVMLPGDLHARLKVRCAVDGTRMGAIVRDLVEQACKSTVLTEKGRSAKAKQKAGAEAA